MTSTNQRRATLLSVIFSGLCVVLPARTSAQEVQITGPLAGAPAVHKMRVYREGRLQLKPFVAFTLQDEFDRAILVGGQLAYHFTDWLGIGAWGGAGLIHIDTSLTDEVVALGQSTDRNRLSLPSAQNFDEQIGKIQWAAALQLMFIPLRGKLALFQKIFLDADFYVFGGVAAVGLEERADVTVPGICSALTPQCLESQTARSTRTAIAPTFGAGLSIYGAEFLSVTLEWRAIPFAWNTSGTDEGGRDVDGNLGGGDFPDGLINEDDHIFHLNHMLSIGVAFYLPPAAEISD